MMVQERIFAQALTLAGDLDTRQTALLRVLCQGAEKSLMAQLRNGVTDQDCQADFISAAGLMALAALSETSETETVERFTAGDMTIHKARNSAAANCLRYQAKVMMSPYLKDTFLFQGV